MDGIKLDFLKKLEENPYSGFYWNIPEVRQGKINVVGGNSQGFRAPIKTAEFLTKKYPLGEVNLVLPDALKTKLPPLDNLVFLSSTESGSFADGEEISNVLQGADFNVLIGDLSRNKVTGKAIGSALGIAGKDSSISGATSVKNEGSASGITGKPLLITRDAVDVLAENCDEEILMNEKLIIFGSMAQLQKIFKAVYYPKMLLLSQSLIQVADALHKFTLSYPLTIITLHAGQILVAKDGEVVAVPLEKSGYSPIMIWGGELAAKIAVLNLYNPNNFLKASVAAIFA